MITPMTSNLTPSSHNVSRLLFEQVSLCFDMRRPAAVTHYCARGTWSAHAGLRYTHFLHL